MSCLEPACGSCVAVAARSPHMAALGPQVPRARTLGGGHSPSSWGLGGDSAALLLGSEGEASGTVPGGVHTTAEGGGRSSPAPHFSHGSHCSCLLRLHAAFPACVCLFSEGLCSSEPTA